MHRKSSVINRSCPNPECEFHGQSKKQNIIKYGYFKLKKGRRRRYLCKSCKSAYLHRLTPSHARRPEYLEDHLELLQCHYNFIRPHSALKYGNEIWTPAMQAGLTSKRLTFRQVFLAATAFSFFVSILCLKRRQNVKFRYWWYVLATVNDGSTPLDRRPRKAGWQMGHCSDARFVGSG